MRRIARRRCRLATDLYPLYRPGTPRKQAALEMVDEMIGTGASNNWVVSGARTRSGKPLLANDPHLRLTAPSIWYLAHLALERPGAAAVNMAGARLAGMPLIVLGRSDTLAWGFTNTGADVQDIFIEKINPDNRGQYLTPEGWRAFETSADGDRRQGGRRAQRGAAADAARARAAGLLPQPRGACWATATWRRCSGRR